MSIRSVSISEYRNIEKLNIQLFPRANVFTGLNGQGKTNILEAIYFSLRGYSFRTQDHRDLIRKTEADKENLTRVTLDIQQDQICDRVQAILLDQKKILKLNDKPVSTQRLSTEFPLVLFSPDSLSAIKNGPEYRRELMTEMLILDSPQSHQIIHDYQKALRGRNRFLKDLLKENSSKINYELLGALSESLFNLAIELIKTRIEIIRAIRPIFIKTAQMILKDQSAMELGYLMSDVNVLDFTVSEIEEFLHRRRLELYDAELKIGATLWGPHKHDLLVTHSGNEARYFCSQGQQRALILALKISQIVHHFECYGKYPILLLDDVFSELDRERRAYLLDFLSTLKTQSILTCTDVENLEGFFQRHGNTATSLYEVSEGTVCIKPKSESPRHLEASEKV